jgi:DNA-binding SARP family transcriptional activator/tetratricopeptide (TPR) repeat protein
VASPANERTRIQLCGRLSVEIDGAQLADTLRGKQVPLLLAYLLLNRARPVGREELIGALWPNHAPVSQDAALRTLLSRLRSGLGSDALIGRDELALNLPAPVWIDLEAAGLEIERARAALERGDPRGAWALAQVPLNIARRGLLPGSQATWLEPWRRELEDIRLQALEVIGRAGLKLGGTQLASAERAARTVLDAEPYRESGYVLLMEALEAQGNIPDALRVFEQLRTLLRDELGTMPSPDTVALHDRLLRPSARPAEGRDQPETTGSPIALPAELTMQADAPLVGRRHELEELRKLWQRACNPGGSAREAGRRLVLLTGDPGIGKSRLVAELASNAHEGGAFVLAGRSPEEALVPYQPFIEALRQYVQGVPYPMLRASTREYGAELSRLIPDLRRRVPELAPAANDELETERYRLFEAVVGLLAEISRTAPVLLVLDDLHWADRPTLLLLRHLARTINPARLLILGAYRATETHADGFIDTLAALRHDGLVLSLPVGGLAEDETAELVRVHTGVVPTKAFSRALQSQTEGNPFFIGEIVRQLAEAGVRADRAGARDLHSGGLPEGVKEVIARRLARLDAEAIEWLRAAAVIGRDFDLGLLEQVLALGEDDFLTALEAALAAGLVVELPSRPGRYSFSHALIRETLYEGMSAPRRARIHRRVGEVLEAQGPERNLAALALHFTRAAGSQDAEKAIEYATLAGSEATDLLAHEEAADHYLRALEVLERISPDDAARRCELLVLLGEARVRAGERPLAWETFREAATLALRLGNSAMLARAALGASRRYIQPPGVVDEELIALLEQALELTGEDQGLVRVALLTRLCAALYYSQRRGEMTELAAEASALAQKLGDPEALALAAAARRRAFWDPSRLGQRVADSTELLTRARETGDLELVLQGHAWLIVDLLEQGNPDAVEAQIEAFSAGAERLRQPLYLWNLGVWRAMRALLAGRLEEADTLASEALALGAHGETITAPQYYAIQLLAIRREQARLAELEQPARELVASNPHRPAWRAALATLLWEAGRTDEAREEFELLAGGAFANIPEDGDWLIAITLLAETAAHLGDRERAGQLYDLLLPYRSGNVVIGLATVCLGAAARILGGLAKTIGDTAAAAEHYELALEANAALRTPVYLAHTQLDYAELLGSDPRARGLIEAAARTASELRLPAVARQAERLQGN